AGLPDEGPGRGRSLGKDCGKGRRGNMKQEALAISAAEGDPGRRLNLLREYAQAFALRSLHEAGAFENLSFVGGTALRFLFDLARFSEDLDFSLENPAGSDLEKWMGKLERDFRFAGSDLSLSTRKDKVGQTAGLRRGGILREAGLAALRARKLPLRSEFA